MTSCIPGPPEFKHDHAATVYYGALKTCSENEALQMALLLDTLLEPEVWKQVENLTGTVLDYQGKHREEEVYG